LKRLSWAEKASRDLDAIEEHWLPDQPEFVLGLTAAVLESIRFLMDTPGAGSPVDVGSIRKWRLGRTHYLLLYRFTRSELRILRIHHEHEDWKPTP
jgi:toxin ParE1/3/4